jgi:2-polyprenyl-3-methyl-5-hydroxy-6-metoxy-1,4-benzoquinol methylase
MSQTGTISYRFEEVLNCEMCGDPATKHKIIGQRLNKTQGLRPRKKEGITVSVKKCTQCKLIYSSPLPVPFNIQDHYGIPPESYWQPGYFKTDPGYFSDQITTAKKLLNFKPGMKSLDIGAGIGKCMISMQNAGFDSYGFEPSQPYYDRAISKMNISKDKLRLGMIEEMDHEENSFDFITYSAVFEHLYHPAFCLKKSLKWLKPGGVIHIEVPSSSYLAARLVNFYYRLTGTNYVSNLSPMHVPFHLYEFSLKSFTELSGSAGFTIKHHTYYVGKSILVPKLVAPVLHRCMKWTNTGMQLEIWLSK